MLRLGSISLISGGRLNPLQRAILQATHIFDYVLAQTNGTVENDIEILQALGMTNSEAYWFRGWYFAQREGVTNINKSAFLTLIKESNDVS